MKNDKIKKIILNFARRLRLLSKNCGAKERINLYFIKFLCAFFTEEEKKSLLSPIFNINLRKFFEKMKIHKEGYVTIVIVALLALTVSGVGHLYLSTWFFIVLSIWAFVTLGLVLFFFRDPIRRPYVTDDGALIAPADGTVVAVEKVFEPEYFKDERLQISIFMSVFNVHKNFFPIGGELVFYKHHKGHFHRAFLPKSSSENERSTVVVRHHSGREVLFRQVAGAMARRIVSYVKEGQQVEQSHEMGFIKFGSRVDVFVPADAKVQVQVGDKTVGSRTFLVNF